MSHLLRKAALSTIGGSLLVATLGLGPAGAEKPETPPGHEQSAEHEPQQSADTRQRSADRDGDADSDASTSYTEDTDTNDGNTANNVEDDGDNRHPSGRDRSLENRRSGNQGRSEADPDDDGRGADRTNGGADKPNGPGGDDLADQDGNNGCGNDDDFEDDNMGWCGKPAEQPAAAMPATAAKPAAKPAATCPNGSMTRPCNSSKAAGAAAVQAHAQASAQAQDAPAFMQTADAFERVAAAPVVASCPAGHDMGDADTISKRCSLVAEEAVADEDSDDTGVMNAQGAAAAAEVPASTVSARSGGGVLASLPVVGSVIDGQLPFTGIPTITFLAVALGALVVGFAMVRGARRSSAI